MAKKKSGDDGGGSNDWLNTYADMVTLLLTFFAVLLSMSNTDEQKFNAFVRSFSNLPQEVIDEITSNNDDDEQGEDLAVETDFDQLYEDIKNYIIENNYADSIEISKVDDVIYIRFNDALFFLPDSYTLLSSSLPLLEFIGGGLSSYEDSIKMINVIGHTATVDVGTYWMLSGQRAATVVNYLNYEAGIDGKKLLPMGYGNQYPVAPNDTEEGRLQNRRCEFVIISEDSDSDFVVYEQLEQLYDAPQTGAEGDAIAPGTDPSDTPSGEEFVPETDPNAQPETDPDVDPDVSPFDE